MKIDSSMLSAWIVLSAFGLASYFLTPQLPEYSHGLLAILSVFMFLFYPAVVVLFVNQSISIAKSDFKFATVWAYIWRTVLVKYIAMFVVGGLCLAILGKGPYTSTSQFIGLGLLHLVVSLVLVWLLFSEHKVRQLKVLFNKSI